MFMWGTIQSEVQTADVFTSGGGEVGGDRRG